MKFRISHGLTLGAVLLLGGCESVSETLWPSLSGDDPVGPPVDAATTQQASAAAAQAIPTIPTAPLPQLGSTNFQPINVTSFQTTGTFVGQKVANMRAELGGLQQRISQRNQTLQLIRQTTIQNAQRYHGTIAAVNARLQLGTTPGNPILITQWNQAQAELDRIGTDIAAMNSLANEVAADSSFAAYLLEASRATYGLSGAIDEDHRQIAVLEDETNQTVVLVDRLLNELSEDVSRQTAYVGNERSNLTTLSLAVKNGELYGSSLANRAFSTAAPLASAVPPGNQFGGGYGANYQTFGNAPSYAAANTRPLVVIRFDRPDVPFQQALYTAVAKTIERRPDAMFELVAVTPASGSAAQVAAAQTRSRKNAQKVLRSLTDMGLPANRLKLSATSSTQTNTNEVHIYVR